MEDTPEENDNASGTGNAAKSKKGKSRKEGFNLKDEVISWIQVLVPPLLSHYASTISSSQQRSPDQLDGNDHHGWRPRHRLTVKLQIRRSAAGDIAIFIYPDDEAKGIKTYYVKRIIGMPGDTIDIVDGKVF